MLPLILKKDIRLTTLSGITRDELLSLRDAIHRLQVLDIDNVHESFLPWLAWWFRVDVWDDSWSDEQKREVIKNALVLFKYKGTIWAVKRALSLTGYDSTITPWYQQSPVGTRGTFFINVSPSSAREFIADDYKTIFKLVESNKQGSQTWTSTVSNDIDGLAYFACIVRSHSKITIGNKS